MHAELATNYLAQVRKNKVLFFTDGKIVPQDVGFHKLVYKVVRCDFARSMDSQLNMGSSDNWALEYKVEDCYRIPRSNVWDGLCFQLLIQCLDGLCHRRRHMSLLLDCPQKELEPRIPVLTEINVMKESLILDFVFFKIMTDVKNRRLEYALLTKEKGDH